MRRRRIVAVAAVGLAMAAALSPVRAQGTLSTQGLGFPPGQMSTQAKAMGGATGETDPLSALNPAAIGLLQTAILMLQVEPEYRTLTFGDQTVRTSLSRFPLFMGAMPFGSRWSAGLAVSTLLDRTFETTIRDTQIVAGETIPATVTERSEGSISDIRLALSYAPSPWLRVGLAGHALSGSDVLVTTRTFDDTISFATDAQRTVVGFGGNAISAGAVAMFPRRGALGVTYRRGGTINAYDGSEVVGTGRAPDHLGISLVYLGIRGSALAVRAAKDNWSALEGMSPTLNIHEGWDIGVGADVTGPRLGGSAIGLRAGARWRTLPFSASNTAVDEQTWSGGFVLPLGRLTGQNRAVELQMGALRSSRSHMVAGPPPLSVKENSWTLSTGFAIRP